MNDTKQAQENKPQGGAPSFSVRAQYIKDLSFENPHAPHSLMAADKQPAIDVNVDLKAQKLEEDIFETNLLIKAKASIEDNTMFIAELAYGGVFQLVNVPEDKIEQLLLVDCPFVLFPFARRIIADATRDGGFPPLLLDPMDFHALYLQNRKQKEEASA